MNHPRITQIAAGSPATAEEARELAGMAMATSWMPIETCPDETPVLVAWEELPGHWMQAVAGRIIGNRFTDGERNLFPACWLPLPAAPEVPHA